MQQTSPDSITSGNIYKDKSVSNQVKYNENDDVLPMQVALVESTREGPRSAATKKCFESGWETPGSGESRRQTERQGWQEMQSDKRARLAKGDPTCSVISAEKIRTRHLAGQSNLRDCLC